MAARWGARWASVATLTSAGKKQTVLDLIRELEDAYRKRMEAEEAQRKRLQELIRNSPKGDFPTPTKARTLAGFGDPQPAPARTDWRRRMIPDPPRQPLLVFRRISPFAFDKSVLTPQLKEQVRQVVDFVKSNLYPPNPIGVIRIVGHTDGTGTEAHNIGLGNRRMEAVRKELHAQLGDLVRLVLVDTEESPGKSKPIGDNRTEKGRAANRRVDVYVGPPIPKAEPWTKPYKWTWTPPPPPPPDWCLDCDLTPLGGKSVHQFLMDLCGRRFKRDTCKTIVDKLISGGCSGIAAFLGQIGATISDEQKKVIEKHCRAAANKKIGVPQR
jgi:outer membrane protein OmpA-like peptidoglycan-associated protein